MTSSAGSEYDVDVSGSRFGLSLTLNIEQYEYMIGPQSDAGIKVPIQRPIDQPPLCLLSLF